MVVMDMMVLDLTLVEAVVVLLVMVEVGVEGESPIVLPLPIYLAEQVRFGRRERLV